MFNYLLLINLKKYNYLNFVKIKNQLNLKKIYFYSLYIEDLVNINNLGLFYYLKNSLKNKKFLNYIKFLKNFFDITKCFFFLKFIF